MRLDGLAGLFWTEVSGMACRLDSTCLKGSWKVSNKRLTCYQEVYKIFRFFWLMYHGVLRLKIMQQTLTKIRANLCPITLSPLVIYLALSYARATSKIFHRCTHNVRKRLKRQEHILMKMLLQIKSNNICVPLKSECSLKNNKHTPNVVPRVTTSVLLTCRTVVREWVSYSWK